MAKRENLESQLLIVPTGAKSLPDSFTNFLWEQEIAAFLVKPEWVGQPESGETGLGIRVAPGSA